MKTDLQLNEDLILREHNFATYQQLEGLFEQGAQKVGLVQATGTGKSFIALQWLFDNCLMSADKNILYLTSMQPIIQSFKSSMAEVGLDERAFPNLETEIYAGLMRKGVETSKKYDFIILDEFHRVGAEKWGGAVKAILQANPDAKVLGLSATPIRFLDEGRDMAQELFGENVVEGMNLCEAVESGVLPEADYVYAAYSYGILDAMGQGVAKIKDKVKQARFEGWVEKAKRRVEDAEGLEDIFQRKIDRKNGRALGFCSDLQQLMHVKEKIENGLFKKVNPNVKVYQISYKDTADMVRKKIKEFKEDNSDALKILLSVDIFNEGVHIEDADYCMMFRKTMSPRIWLQQVGRVLSQGKENVPVIFDIVNNFESINKVQQIFIDSEKSEGQALLSMKQTFPFRVDEKTFKLAKYLSDLDSLISYYSTSTQQFLGAAERYKNSVGNLNVRADYIEEETGIKLGYWLRRRIASYSKNPSRVDKNVAEKLLELDPNVFSYTLKNQVEERNEKILRFAKIYYNKYGNLAVMKDKNAQDETTNEEINPFLYDQLSQMRNFYRHGKQNRKTSYPEKLIAELIKLDPRVFEENYSESLYREAREEKILRCAKIYFERYGDLAIAKTKVNKEVIKDPDTKENVDLGVMFDMIRAQVNGSKKYNFSREFLESLQNIDPRVFEVRYSETLRREKNEEQILKFAKIYKEMHGNLAVPGPDSKEKKNIVTDKKTGEAFDLGDSFRCIKLYLKGWGSVGTYSERLIEELRKLDPRVFEENYTRNLARERREEKILEAAKQYFADNKHLAVGLNDLDDKYLVFDESGAATNLSTILVNIRLFKNGNQSNGIFSETLISELKSMDPRVFEKNYTKNLRRELKEQKLRACFAQFFADNGHLAVPKDFDSVDVETGEIIKVGREFVQIKAFARQTRRKDGKKTTSCVYSQSLIDWMEGLDPTVFDEKPNKNSKKEREKGE